MPCLPYMTGAYKAYISEAKWLLISISCLLLFAANRLTINSFSEPKTKRNKLLMAFGITFFNIFFFWVIYLGSFNPALIQDAPPASIEISLGAEVEQKVSILMTGVSILFLLVLHVLFLFLAKKILGKVSRKQLWNMYLVNFPLWWGMIMFALGFVFISVHPFIGLTYNSCMGEPLKYLP